MTVKLVLLRMRTCAECDRQESEVEDVRAASPPGVEVRISAMDARPPPEIVRHYAPTSHPTIVLDKDQHEVARWSGFTPKETLLPVLRQHATGAKRAGSQPQAQPGPPGVGGAPPPEGEAPPPVDHVGPPVDPPPDPRRQARL